MNNETMLLLEKQFDTAFAAPDGIQKLRELILTLAMQGKLVPQDPNDQPASELFKAIELEKKRLVKEGKIKQPKPLLEIKPEEIPYKLPNGWQWIRLGSSIIFTNGYAFKSTLFQSQGVGIIKIGDISNGTINKERMDFIDNSYLEEVDEKFRARFGDLLIAMSGATTGKLGFNNREEIFLINQRVGKIEPILIEKFYLYHFLSTQIQKNLAISSGSAIPNLSTEQINETLIPLPPLAEQQRIVAKIDQLMARCDELEKLRSDRAQKLITVHTAAIAHLLTAKDSDDFSTAWHFITQHFGELYSVKETVAELRKAILQLAVMGKLVPQDQNDEPASELLKAIEGTKLVKIHKSKLIPEIKLDDLTHELPNTWEWVRLGSIFDLKSGCSFPKEDELQSGKYMYLKVGEMNSKGNELVINFTSIFLNDSKKVINSLIPANSIIFPKRGGAIATNKKRLVIEPICVDTNIMAMICPDIVELAFAYHWILSVDLAMLNTGTSVPQINNKDVSPLLFPLPPLAEQRRIVAKIDQLMTLCDRLEEAIAAAQTKQADLLNAVMASTQP